MFYGQVGCFLKCEFCGVWVVIVFNFDYFKFFFVWLIVYQEEWCNLLDKFKVIGFNVVVVQVCLVVDVFYFFVYVLWLAYLIGKQGLLFSLEYDVFKFMIEEVYEWGMDFYVWFNFYWVSMNFDIV